MALKTTQNVCESVTCWQTLALIIKYVHLKYLDLDFKMFKLEFIFTHLLHLFDSYLLPSNLGLSCDHFFMYSRI